MLCRRVRFIKDPHPRRYGDEVRAIQNARIAIYNLQLHYAGIV